MPQRNANNPIKSEKNFGQGGVSMNEPSNIHDRNKSSVILCPSCKAEVPPKPGFRVSSLKCPKCGSAMSKR